VRYGRRPRDLPDLKPGLKAFSVCCTSFPHFSSPVSDLRCLAMGPRSLLLARCPDPTLCFRNNLSEGYLWFPRHNTMIALSLTSSSPCSGSKLHAVLFNARALEVLHLPAYSC
jgi:hypothetical protein